MLEVFSLACRVHRQLVDPEPSHSFFPGLQGFPGYQPRGPIVGVTI